MWDHGTIAGRVLCNGTAKTMYTYPVQIAVGEKTSTTGDRGPAALPATLLGVFQRRSIDAGLLQRSGALLLGVQLGLGLQTHCEALAIVATGVG